MSLLARLLSSVFVSVIVSTLYYGLGDRIQEEKGYDKLYRIYELCGSMFFLTSSQLMISEAATSFEFIKERNVFINEIGSSSYSISAYFASKLALELPLLILQPIIENTLTFWTIGYTNTWETFFKILLVYFVNMQVGTSIGYLASAFADNMMSCAQSAPLTTLPFVSFAGFISNVRYMPKFIKYLSWLSPARYAFEAVMWA